MFLGTEEDIVLRKGSQKQDHRLYGPTHSNVQNRWALVEQTIGAWV